MQQNPLRHLLRWETLLPLLHCGPVVDLIYSTLVHSSAHLKRRSSSSHCSVWLCSMMSMRRRRLRKLIYFCTLENTLMCTTFYIRETRRDGDDGDCKKLVQVSWQRLPVSPIHHLLGFAEISDWRVSSGGGLAPLSDLSFSL